MGPLCFSFTVIDRPTDADELDYRSLKTGTILLQRRASYLKQSLLVSLLPSLLRFCNGQIYCDLNLLRSRTLESHDGPGKEQSGYDIIHFHRRKTSVSIILNSQRIAQCFIIKIH